MLRRCLLVRRPPDAVRRRQLMIGTSTSITTMTTHPARTIHLVSLNLTSTALLPTSLKPNHPVTKHSCPAPQVIYTFPSKATIKTFPKLQSNTVNLLCLIFWAPLIRTRSPERAIMDADYDNVCPNHQDNVVDVLDIIEPVRIAKDGHLRALNNLYNITRSMLQ